jgi:hypothetical protein
MSSISESISVWARLPWKRILGAIGLFLGIAIFWGLGAVIEYYVFNEHRVVLCIVIGLVWAIVLFIPSLLLMYLVLAMVMYLQSWFPRDSTNLSPQPQVNLNV